MRKPQQSSSKPQQASRRCGCMTRRGCKSRLHRGTKVRPRATHSHSRESRKRCHTRLCAHCLTITSPSHATLCPFLLWSQYAAVKLWVHICTLTVEQIQSRYSFRATFSYCFRIQFPTQDRLKRTRTLALPPPHAERVQK